jgi:hypothetical protein
MNDRQKGTIPAFTEHRFQHDGGSLSVRDFPAKASVCRAPRIPGIGKTRLIQQLLPCRSGYGHIADGNGAGASGSWHR